MTLEEAIKELQSYNFLCEPVDAERLSSAIKLGIEAVKFIIVSRPDPNFGHIPNLPGETEK